ncbi:MAG: hypothetical protein ACLS90_04775 [Clostridia bacterium]
MKKILSIFIIFIILASTMITAVQASDYKHIELNLKILDYTRRDKVNLSILLPKDYIIYAINNSNLNIEYKGVETLKDNDIIGIEVNKNNINDELYVDNNTGIEYIQIRLEPNSEGNYTFNILENYKKLDMKFRITNDEKDYIMHIDNFKTENNVCKIEYNYTKDKLKQPETIKVNFITLFFIVILIILVIITIMVKVKVENNKY